MADTLLAAGVSVDQAKALRTILARFTKTPTPEHQQAVRDAVVELAVQSHTYIVSMESGARPITLRTIDKLAPALGLTAAQLLAELDAEMGGAR